MRIINKVLKDRNLALYEYTAKCPKCGYTEKSILPRKKEIDLARKACLECMDEEHEIMSARIKSEEPLKLKDTRPIVKINLKPKKSKKSKKSNRDKK